MFYFKNLPLFIVLVITDKPNKEINTEKENMKKNIIRSILYIVLTSSTILIYSCESQLDKDREQFETEVKPKLVEKYKCDNIDDCISKYQFEGARAYMGATLFDEFGENEEGLRKITRAEITYLIENGELEKAKSVANESDMWDEYQNAIPQLLTTLIEKREYDQVFAILLTWKFKYTFVSTDEWGENADFNEERNLFNDLVDNVFKSAIFNNNLEIAKKCLFVYAPISIEHKYNGGFDLKNEAKDAAIKQLQEQGRITIK
jgi:hypothetical protein